MSDPSLEAPDTAGLEPDTTGHYETETVTEVVDYRRRHWVLSLVLVLLVLLLGAGAYYVWRVSQPVGAPQGAEADGMEWIRSIYGWGELPTQLLVSPTDVAMAPDGTLWTISSKTTIVGFNPDGSAVRVLPFERGGQPGQVGSIEGLDVDEAGNLYLADFGLGKVHVVSPTGTFIREYQAQLASEVAVEGDRIAVATLNGIVIYDTQGQVISQFGTRGNQKDQFDNPHGIAWGADGNLYVSDTLNRRIKAYSPDGRLIYIAPKSMETAKRAGVQAGREMTGTPQTPYQVPSGMTRDAAGRILLVDPFNFSIMAHDSKTGTITASFGEFGSADGMFAYPTGMDYDTGRDYFVVADTANNRLQIVRLPGSGGNALQSALRRLLDGPVWLCLFPLGLLVLALMLWYLKRRWRNRDEPQHEVPK